jgi:hypothetical protein
MMLDDPDMVEADLICQHYLLNDVVEVRIGVAMVRQISR